MLWVAGALAFVAGLPQLGVAVFVVVLLNGIFAFAQERRAEHAAERLRDLLPRRATVVRDGIVIDVPAEDLVVGDLVVLEGGDRISADLRVERAHALALDTSTLSGESTLTRPDDGEMLFAGSFVVEGEAEAIVEAIGAATRLAGIARLASTPGHAKSPLALELDRVVRFIAGFAIAVGTTFFGASLLVGTDPTDGFLFAIGVTVAVVPEGLLPTVTLSLAIGAQRMAKQHALVRHLEAVETLGSTTIICTDKTGTLTVNQMSVVEVWTPDGAAQIDGTGYEPTARIAVDAPEVRTRLRDVAIVATRCSNGRAVLDGDRWVARGDPMEAALDALAHRIGADVGADERDGRERARFPFDPRRRRMSIVTNHAVLVKGAPDAVLPRCVDGVDAHATVERLAARGLRTLAIASRPLADGDVPVSADEAESGLELLGLVGLEDPPRPHAAAAIGECRQAGIKVVMITGDHPATALAIAREVGLFVEGAPAISGHDLPDDDVALGELIDADGAVVSRVSPEDKLRIAAALRGRGHVVAMTGDGVNDGPALHEADIGIAMGMSGTDVAREAADLVLLDDDFETIVRAVEEGRATFANIRRFLTYHLTDNVAELTPFVIWALSGGAFPLALGVLQVLALDIGTDILPALALGAEPPGPHLLDGPPVRRHLLDRALFTRAFGLLGPVEAAMEMAAFLAVFLAAGWAVGDDFPGGDVMLAASGAAFTAVVIGQLGNAFACRSTVRPAWQLGWTTNRLLLWAIGAELLMLAGFLFIPPLADLLDQAPPTLAGFAVALLAAPAVLTADTVAKMIRARRVGARVAPRS
jgi:calcium-translocating P-type ATPase